MTFTKTGRIVSIAAVSVFLIVLVFFLVYITRIRFAEPRFPDGLSCTMVVYSPLGKETVLDPGRSCAGFFTSAYIETDRKITDTCLTFYCSSGTLSFNPEKSGGISENSAGKIRIPIPDEIFPVLSFKEKFILLLHYGPVQPWLLGLLLFLIVLIAEILFFRSLSRRIKSRVKCFQAGCRSVVPRVLVIISFGLFWLLLLMCSIEISLRFSGMLTALETQSIKPSRNDTYTILCVGDSFTYGIGSSPGMNYTARLSDLILKETGVNVNVINRGMPGANSAMCYQILSSGIETYSPDAVVMLFGMANGGQYTAAGKEPRFFSQLKIFRLARLMKEQWQFNITQTNFREDLNDRIGEYTAEARNAYLSENNPAKMCFYAGKTLLLTGKNIEALKCFISGTDADPSYLPNYLGFFKASLKTGPVGESGSSAGLYADWLKQKVPLSKNRDTLYYLLARHYEFQCAYHDSAALWIRKAISENDEPVYYDALAQIEGRYSADSLSCAAFKGISPGEITYRCRRYFMQHDYEKVITESGNTVKMPEILAAIRMVSLFRTGERAQMSAEIKRCKRSHPGSALLSLVEAAVCLYEHSYAEAFAHAREAYEINPREISVYLLMSKIPGMQAGTGSLLQKWFKTIDYFTYGTEKKLTLFLQSDTAFKKETDRNIIPPEFFIHLFSDWLRNEYAGPFVRISAEEISSPGDSVIMAGIDKDIRRSIQLCKDRGIPCIVQNYPLIPPPNPRQISYWGKNAGLLWQQNAKIFHIPFVNHDSVFDLLGEEKNSYFEPRETGSWHCNDKGYGLMAMNLLQSMKRSGLTDIIVRQAASGKKQPAPASSYHQRGN